MRLGEEPTRLCSATDALAVLRISAIDFPALFPSHARAAAMGGRWLFFASLGINGLLAVWAIRAAVTGAQDRQGRTAQRPEEH